MKRATLALGILSVLAAAAVGPEARAADDKQVAKLVKQLKDKKDEKRTDAAYQLVHMKAEAAVPALTEALHDKVPLVRYNALAALWNIGDAARPAIPEMVKLLADPDLDVRIQAAGALDNFDANAAEWVAAVRTALDQGGMKAETRDTARKLLKRAGNGGIQAAANQGQADVVAGLLAGGIEPDAVDKHKRTALHWAATAGKADVVKLLLDKGASVSLADEEGDTPLHLAAMAPSVDVVRMLLDKKADPNVLDQRQFSPLHLAAGKGGKPMVEMMLAHGGNPRLKGNSGASALHIAAAQGQAEVVQLLLAKGLDINLGDEKSQGPIFYAAAGGHTDLVKLFLDKRAATRGSGLMRDMTGTPLHDAARGGHVATMELLIARGIPLDATEFGRTAFQVAANEGQVEAMKLLLAKGAKVDYVAPQTSGETALFLAAFQGHLEAVRFLVEHGASVTFVETGRGRTPLHEAVDNGGMNDERRQIVTLLLDKGAKIDAKDKEGKTPLAIAQGYRNDEAVKLLQQRGATN